MKIDQTTGTTNPVRLPTRPHSNAAPPGTGAETASTPAAGSVRPFPESADGTFNAAKVNAIREQIRNGQYKINPERIAEGMLASAREMLSAKTKV